MPPAKEIVLPDRISIRNKNKEHLTGSITGLIFHETVCGVGCIFEVESCGQSTYKLTTHDHQILNTLHVEGNDYRLASGVTITGSELVGSDLTFIHTTGNSFYIQTKPSSSGVTPQFVTSNWEWLNLKHSLTLSTYITDDTLFEISEPIIKKEIYDIEYHITDGASTNYNLPPLVALNTSIFNDSTSDKLTQNLTYSYAKSVAGTWNNTAGVTAGVKTSIKADIPFLAEGKVEISASASYSHQWGGSVGTTETISSATQVEVPPKKKGNVLVLIKQAELTVEFTYKEKVTYVNGETKIVTGKKGVYHNIESYDVDVQVKNTEVVEKSVEERH